MAFRTGRITHALRSVTRRTLEGLWHNLDVIEVTPTLAQAAGDLAEQHGLRGYDAVHLASALVVPADVLVSADGDLLTVAASVGLHVIDARS